MKTILGILLFIGGIALGIYVGLWVCFVGGILGLVEVVNGMIDGNGVDGMLIVWSILKMMFASFLGYLSAVALVLPGLHLMK
jgi:hypothetical protein